MLYLSHPARVQSVETQRALNAADGYLYFSLLDEALAELGEIPAAEQKEAAVMLARIRLLLHKKEWRSAEAASISTRSMSEVAPTLRAQPPAILYFSIWRSSPTTRMRRGSERARRARCQSLAVIR